jgi:AcrR family transcriptional regulator
MFHYYFTNKDNFDQALLRTIYEDMMSDIKINVLPQASPKHNVRVILFAISSFIQKNRILLSSLAGDVLRGENNIISFISQNFLVHLQILLAELKRAKESGQLKTEDEFDAVLILGPSLALPQGLLGLLERLPGGVLKHIKTGIITRKIESGVPARIDMLLDAVFKE